MRDALADSVRALGAGPGDALAVGFVALAVLLTLLGAAVHLAERAPRATGEPIPAERSTPTVAPGRPARHRYLNALELARLTEFRARARLLEGEPLGRPGWSAQVRQAWRSGYSGWILACLAGAFSMATHFGVWWLAAGGGWAGAVAVTLLCTLVMVAACAWVGLGLIAGR